MAKSLIQALSSLGEYKLVESITEQAFEIAEKKAWRENLDDSPHGEKWHTSFHASSFPGDDERACGRKAIYTLMNTPSVEATPRKLRGQGEVGKAVELMLVKAYGQANILLSNNQTSGDKFQTNFTDHECWLTGNVDVVLLPWGWNKPHVVEVKTKAHDVVKQMKQGERGPDVKHTRQCKTYIGLAHENAHYWPNLLPCETGTIYYLSRDDPSYTHEFFYEYDPSFMAAGREKLKEWQEAFIQGELPPHPFKGKEWSIEPCKYCPFKKFACKPDQIDGITRLSESHAIEFAEEVYGEYDYESTRQEVLDRWNETSNS